jgi:PAS domain S-box-containing protein
MNQPADSLAHQTEQSGSGGWCGFAVVGRDLRLLELDAALAALACHEPEALIGQPVALLAPSLEAPLRTVLTTATAALHLTKLGPHGDIPARLHLAPLRSSRGGVVGVEITVVEGEEVRPAPDVHDWRASLSVQTVLDSLFAFAGVLLPDGTLVEANRAALEAAGLRPADVLGRPFAEAYWWSYDPGVQAELRAAIARAARGERVRYDVQVRLGPERFTTIDFMLAPARDEQGQVRYLIPSATDISERKRIEAMLLASQHQLSLALDAARMGTWEIDLTSQHVWRSPSTDRLFGLAPNDAVRSADDYFGRVHADDIDRVSDAIRQTVEVGAEHAVEYRVVHPNGAVRWLASRGELIHDEHGAPQRLVGALVDVTERHEAQAALQASEERFRAIFERAPLGISQVALDGRWLSVNPKLCSIVGYSPEELTGRRFQDLTHPDDLDVNLGLLRQLLAGEIASYDLEKRYVHKDGSAVWVNLTVSLVRTGTGAPASFITVVEDISRRKAAERELRFQAQLLDAVGQGVIATDLSGAVRYWSRFAEELYGWTRAEALGRNLLDLVATEQSLQQGREILGRVQAGERWAGTYFVRRRDGSTFPAFVTDTPLYAPDGSVSGTVGVFSDISEQLTLAAEREELLLREREARTSAEQAVARIALLQEVTAALSEALTPGQVAEVILNHALAALGGRAGSIRLVSPDGKTLEPLRSLGGLPYGGNEWARIPLDAPVPVAQVARMGSPMFFEGREPLATAYPELERAASSLGYEAFAIVPLGIEGRVIGSLALVFAEARPFSDEDRDVLLAMAGQGAQAIARARLYDAARSAVEVRDSFITIASHDLRAPLTVLVGQAGLLERQASQAGLPERLVRRARLISEQAQRLNRMITALYDLSRIQSGQLAIEVLPVDLAALAERIAGEIQPTLSAHTLEVTGELGGLWVGGDELRLEHVLYNLVTNAVKYSPEGGVVTIHAERRGDEARVTVSDTGIGIPPEALPRLFERFYRARNAEGSQISGMGVGLYAVREIVTLHGGSVSVASEVGAGSSFTVALPLLRQHDEATDPRP